MFESARRDLAWVPRWATLRVLHRQSVAEHSYFVACYGLEIAKRLGLLDDNNVGLRLCRYLLRHDEDETISGDIPGPIKRSCHINVSGLDKAAHETYGPREACEESFVRVKKAADILESCMYLAGEIGLGNGTVKVVLDVELVRLEQAIDNVRGVATDKDALKVYLVSLVNQECQYRKTVSIL